MLMLMCRNLGSSLSRKKQNMSILVSSVCLHAADDFFVAFRWCDLCCKRPRLLGNRPSVNWPLLPGRVHRYDTPLTDLFSSRIWSLLLVQLSNKFGYCRRELSLLFCFFHKWSSPVWPIKAIISFYWRAQWVPLSFSFWVNDLQSFPIYQVVNRFQKRCNMFHTRYELV